MQITKTLIDKASEICGSDSKLAERIGVSKQLVSKWRNGKGMPDALAIGKMAELAGVNLDQALLARQLDELDTTAEGKAMVERWKKGFLAGAVAIFATFNGNATEYPTKLCPLSIDTIYIVSRRLRTWVFKLVAVTMGALQPPSPQPPPYGLAPYSVAGAPGFCLHEGVSLRRGHACA